MQTVKNIIKSPRNIKRDLTEKEKILTLSLVILTLSLAILTLNFANIIPTSALTYQDNVNVQFTFDPTLSISLSSNNLTIDNLTPGNYGNSNTISVNVSTNNVMGYTLNAKVGGEGQTAASSNLVNTTANTSFTSLGSSDSLTLANFADNKWGYTTATTPNGSSTTYSGLLYNVDTTINATVNSNGSARSGYPGTNSTSFTIGAKAASGQLAGNYTNVITFTAVSNAIPSKTIYDLTYMQDFATLTTNEKNSVLEYMPEDTQYRLKDIRDNKLYYIAKLKDGHVWMTQNLDLLIGGTYQGEPIVLDSTNTDLNKYDMNGDGTGSVFDGYTNADGIITWTPANSTVTGTPATLDFSSGTMSGWNDASAGPAQAEGDNYINRQGTSYANLAACEVAGFTEVDCSHYFVGNYYNWTVAVAMNRTSAWVDNSNMTVMPNSICPKGWRLPNGLTDTNSDGIVDAASDFNYLLKAYNITGTGGTNGIDFVGGVNVGWGNGGFSMIEQAPLYFVRSGYVFASTLYNYGIGGNYWSSTAGPETKAYTLYYTSSGLTPADSSLRSRGRSVRCLLR